MTSWVLAIDEQYPDHWEIAKVNSFWDLRTKRGIKAGDVVYFWRSGASLAGRVVVSEDARNLRADDVLPWRDSDTTPYQQRFTFSSPSEPIAAPKWGEIARATGLRAGPNWAPHSDDPVVEAALRNYFRADGFMDAVDLAFPTEDAALTVLADLMEDQRERSIAEIAVRRGQGRFRQELLDAYGRCAVTGTTTGSVLEAAHISPYRGEHTNRVQNGLLLRADIHTLFDLHLLTVVPMDGELVARVAPVVGDDHYQDLEGAVIASPRDRGQRPEPAVLAEHNQQCSWLGPAVRARP